MNIKAEFHCHSIASDGKMTPSEVIQIAKKLNLESIALTDHDTTEGLEEAYLEAKKLGVNFIPGIELSCDYKGATIHLLGYFKDDSYKEKELQDFLKNLKVRRVERAEKIVENLEKYFNIKIDYKKVLEKGKGVIARPHIAKTIIEAGYNYEWDQIFEEFIGDDSPAYVPNEKLDVADGVKLLKKFNALVVLAHPKLIKKVPVEEVLSFGVDGIEAIYFQNTNVENSEYSSLAMRLGLIITCGSDCHGDDKTDTKHGFIGDMSI
ncbi:PHP domain-containing protein, partial [uncultured Clostridium sp.]|uniref:PHP domain-containing protein n=1 Tax=uncultured Clostridium sp. TaxID=59620 RepID=UPI002601D328